MVGAAQLAMKASLLLPNTLSTVPMHASEPIPVARTRPLDIETLFAGNADFVFRMCRNLGLDAAAAEDATQQVFMVAANKAARIPEGKERAFLVVTTRNVVANVRRTHARRREDFTEVEIAHEHTPDVLLDHARARSAMETILEAMDLDLRTAFVLFEIEQLSFTEISELLAIPRGTVASRVRRAREDFEQRVARTFPRGAR